MGEFKSVKQTNTNADMSFQNGFRYKLSEFVDSVRENGILITINKLYQRLYYKVKKIDFSTQNLYDLSRVGEHQENGTALVSTSKDFLYITLTRLEEIIGKKLNKSLFIDLGSGKGATLIHSVNFGFDQSIGVEFAKELHEIAIENIKKVKVKNAKSLLEDAATYNFPVDTSIIFMFNPFDKVVMEKAVINIKKSESTFENSVYIIYVNPSCEAALDSHFKLIAEDSYPSGARVNYYLV